MFVYNGSPTNDKALTPELRTFQYPEELPGVICMNTASAKCKGASFKPLQ